MSLRNIKLSRKILLAFAAVVSAVVVTWGVVYTTTLKLIDSERLNSDSYVLVDLVDQMKAATFDQMANVRAFMLTQNPQNPVEETAQRQAFDKDFAKARQIIEQQVDL